MSLRPAQRFLVIIEAPGKVERLSRIFGELGQNVTLFATGGHLFSNPDSLRPLCINAGMQETARSPVNQVLIDEMILLAKQHDFVLIATDPDQEGDVIAADVLALIGGFKGHMYGRLRLRGLDKNSVRDACGKLTVIDPAESWPGTTRRILDRLIGGTLSSLDNGTSVGRVQSALLGAINRQAFPYGKLWLKLPASDGGQPFIATLPVTRDNQELCREMAAMAMDFPPSDVAGIEPVRGGEPWNFGECIINIHERVGVPVDAASEIMQRLYESGRMSYPRSSANALTRDALACLELNCDRANIRQYFDWNIIAKMENTRHAHESPRPMVTNVDIGVPLHLMPPDEASLALITRNLVLSGMICQRQFPDTFKLPEWARALDWNRLKKQPVPWREPDIETGIQYFAPEAAALRVLVNQRLGRPGTQVGHALRFCHRNLADDTLTLTDKGRAWVDATPDALLGDQFSTETERMIESGEVPPEEMVQQIIGTLPKAVREKIQNFLNVQDDPTLQATLKEEGGR